MICSFNWIFGYIRYAEWYVFSRKVTKRITVKEHKSICSLHLFICAYFQYSPGLVPKSTSQNEEDTKESKAREQEQQRRRM
jgi:capsule polysaccharide export protein KpsC/LpsZ